MKLKFELVYDTVTGEWLFGDLGGDDEAKDNNARLRHSGASYLRVKVGDYQIGTIGSYIDWTAEGESMEEHAKRRKGISPVTIAMNYPLEEEITATFK